MAYYQSPNKGASASIGVQNLNNNYAVQYSYQTASVPDGTSIDFNTTCGGTCYQISYTCEVC
ncbi:hypothetical protein CGMCC3_g15311 [Colletotrichum fructicola]|nr:uncharacterized protein CGMCC3_g15311 [Colletotrichum fructicola]KAE9568548.1 hypothetical protein CGMCC3_g15311 [Colletotrichum fructicola]